MGNPRACMARSTPGEKTMRKLLFVTAALVAMIGPASALSAKYFVVSDHAPACETREQMDKIIKFQVQKDIQAMNAVWDTCQEFQNGMEVFVEQNPFFSDNFCVRPAGYTKCFWTNKGLVERRLH
jgi:hypothetical protein